MMKNILTCIFLALPLLFFSQDKKETGNAFIKALLTDKDFEQSYAYFDSSVSSQLSVADLKTAVGQIQEQLGSFKNIIDVNHENSIYYYYSEFEKSKIDIQISFSEQNKIIGFFFIPHKTFENTGNDPNALNIKSSSIELQGTFLKPSANNRKKLVVLIHGSGPQDRNETIGENKPFKDIAEYLQNNGIASYRFDKRTLSNPETFNDHSTAEQEVIEDAVNVVRFFNENYEEYEVMLLGHSFGGYLLPKIAEEKLNISKFIFLAANARPLQELIVEQFEYLNKLDPSNVPAADVKKIKEQVAFLNENKNNPAAYSTGELPLHLSASYWKYLLGYNPLVSLKNIDKPMFFAQGGKDYQVTEKDFNMWKNGLKNNKTAVFKFYPTLTHIFMTGSSIPSPKDYKRKDKVNEELLTDIKDFILKKF